MVKKTNRLFFLFFLFLSCNVYSQSTGNKINSQTQKFAKEVSRIIRKNSLYSDSLNWKQISREVKLLPLSENDSTNHELLIAFFTNKLRQAGDQHSYFLTKKVTASIKNNQKSIQPEGSYLDKGIGLIKIPHCLNLDKSKDIGFANSIRTEIKKIDTSNNIKGWIVDLRHNTGGNMWPMLAGLNALMDDGTVGYYVFPTFKKTRPWIIKNGQINLPVAKTDTYKIRNTKVRIAVLIDSLTGSSGEMIAISFMGLPNVRVFGQPSAGYTTANNTFKLSDGTLFFIASAYVADRTKRPYWGSIIPDEITSSNQNAASDETLEASKRWLLQTVEK